MGDQYLWFDILVFAAVMALAGALVYVLLRGRGSESVFTHGFRARRLVRLVEVLIIGAIPFVCAMLCPEDFMLMFATAMGLAGSIGVASFCVDFFSTWNQHGPH